jgi:hypothetical protein
VVSYYFDVDLRESIQRNSQRAGKARIPVFGIQGTQRKLEPPAPDEGFDEMYVVRIRPAGGFDVQKSFSRESPES